MKGDCTLQCIFLFCFQLVLQGLLLQSSHYLGYLDFLEERTLLALSILCLSCLFQEKSESQDVSNWAPSPHIVLFVSLNSVWNRVAYKYCLFCSKTLPEPSHLPLVWLMQGLIYWWFWADCQAAGKSRLEYVFKGPSAVVGPLKMFSLKAKTSWWILCSPAKSNGHNPSIMSHIQRWQS